MSLRVPAALAVAVSLIILPVIIVRAQAEGDAEALPADELAVESAEGAQAAAQEPEVATSDQAVTGEEVGPEQFTPAASEGEVLGATAGDASTEASGTDTSATTSEPPTAGGESAAPATTTESGSTPAPEFLTLETASSTASSTEPVADPPAEAPKEEPFVLQPAVSLHVSGSTTTADIELENLTCKACGKALPAAQVKAYYTAWYPNDGEIKEVGERKAE